jgi:NAD(P)H-hydrate repair Nnr-like enzyme with NAD(P)H-hydrate dehydratase domain
MRTAIQKMKQTPTLLADAGFMYVAKASGYAPFYDLFLPDLGELAFLADEKAMHPAYTRGFLTMLEDDPTRLIERAFSTGNAARYLCVKGRIDHICAHGKIVEAVGSPMIDALEPIGGTGDTITGMAAGLLSHGYAIPEACRIACSANRIAGQMAAVTPATQIEQIISLIPAALDELLQSRAAGL